MHPYDEDFEMGMLECLSSAQDIASLPSRKHKLQAVFQHLDTDGRGQWWRIIPLLVAACVESLNSRSEAGSRGRE